MESLKNNTEKFCSFYVSNVHLVTMLIPYLSKQMKQGNEFIVFTEKDLETEVEMLLKKINIEKEEKERIKNINWEKCLNRKGNIEEKIKDKINASNNIEIIINGNEKFIEKINKVISKVAERNEGNKTIKIINCYEVMEFNEKMSDILDKHDKILNTSGEKKIEDIFEGYQRKMA